jgi:hypothetical protein
MIHITLSCQSGKRSGSILGRMLESCETCHHQYATDNFPSLGGITPAVHSH